MVYDRLTSISRCMRLGAIVLMCLGWALPARAQAKAGLDDFQAGRFSEAFQAWRQAADQGDAASALYLGVLYDTGTGVTRDYRQALAWYERGAESGNETAMFNAAIMYDAGRGTAANPAAAVTWYERAAKLGYGRAEYNLGLIYESGIGVAPDRERAISFYRAAARHGIAAARNHLIDLGSPYAGNTSTTGGRSRHDELPKGAIPSARPRHRPGFASGGTVSPGSGKRQSTGGIQPGILLRTWSRRGAKHRASHRLVSSQRSERPEMLPSRRSPRPGRATCCRASATPRK